MAEPSFHSIKTIVFDVFGMVTLKPDEVINYQTTLLFGVSKFKEGKDRLPKLVIRHSVIIGNAPRMPSEIVVFGRIETETLFNFDEIDSYFDKEESVYRIPKDLVIPLVEAAVSTARGIALMRGAGTILDSLPIPIVKGAESLKDYETVDIPVPKEEAVETGLIPA